MVCVHLLLVEVIEVLRHKVAGLQILCRLCSG